MVSSLAAEPGLARAFHVTARLGRLDDHGVTRAGHRRVIPIVGGVIAGGIDAQIVPGGADWQIVRPDGTVEIDSRYSAITDAGDLLLLTVAGVRSGPADVLEALLRGDPVPPDAYYFRTSVTIETSSPRLTHLEHSLFVASCIRRADAVEYDAYRVT